MLDELLESLKEGQYDSAGVFTLDVTRAAAKLSSVVANEPNTFLARFQQAAVCNGCDSIRYALTRTGLTAKFNCSDQTSFQAVLDYLGGRSDSLDKAGRYFYLAILSAIALSPSRLTITLSDRSGSRCFDCLASKPLVTTNEGEPNWVCLQFEHTAPDFFSSLLSLVRGTSNYSVGKHDFICSRLGMCPMPVYLDNRLLDPFELRGFNRALAIELAEPAQVRNSKGFCVAEIQHFPGYHVVVAGLRYGTLWAEVDEQFVDADGPRLGIVKKQFSLLRLSSRNDLSVSLQLGEKGSVQSRPRAPVLTAHYKSSRDYVSPVYWENSEEYQLGWPGNRHRLCVESLCGFTRSEEPAKLIAYKDGVLLEPVVVRDWPTSSLVYAETSELEVDADGCRLVRNDNYQAFVARTRVALIQLLGLESRIRQDSKMGEFTAGVAV
jgi:hypothetical protein